MASLDRRSLLISLTPLLAACHAPVAAPPHPPPPPEPAPRPLEEGLVHLDPAATAAQGIDPVALRALVAYESSRSEQLTVLLDGKIVGRWLFAGEDEPIEMMSATKSVVSLAVGLLVDRKKLSLDQPVSDFYPDYREGSKAKVTVRHLMNHTSGIASGQTIEAIYASRDFVQHALSSPLTAEPGSMFFYNNSAVNLLAGLVGRAAGVPVDVLVREEVFRPLGIERFEWLHDAAGNPHGMSGLRLRSIDMSKIGQLAVDGTWAGKRVISEDWLATSTRRPSGPLNPRCGLLWWLEITFRVSIDQPLLDRLRQAGSPEDFLQKLGTMAGRSYTKAEFFPALGRALGGPTGIEQWHANTWKKGLPDGTLSEIEVESFAARGWLGQSIAVVPGKRLVAARLRRSTAARRAATQQGEDPFEKMAQGLVKKV